MLQIDKCLFWFPYGKKTNLLDPFTFPSSWNRDKEFPSLGYLTTYHDTIEMHKWKLSFGKSKIYCSLFSLSKHSRLDTLMILVEHIYLQNIVNLTGDHWWIITASLPFSYKNNMDKKKQSTTRIQFANPLALYKHFSCQLS